MLVPTIILMACAAIAERDGMVWVPGGTFTMGSDDVRAMASERPARQVAVDGFWIDQTEVTNAQFATFVKATGYVTTAERPIEWSELAAQLPPGTPKPPNEDLQPGSAVFTPPDQSVNLMDFGAWWTFTQAADWRHPEGLESSIDNQDNYPVVHVSWDDAAAYAKWAGKQLPTEVQWEHAARFGHDGELLAWGTELTPDDRHMANIWQGEFPHSNTKADGHAGLAPVRSYPPNDLKAYDMIGNVWEWMADGEQRGSTVYRLQKGGSFLCHGSYCTAYRPSARMSTTPDSSFSHVGFRCVSPAEPTPDTDPTDSG
jgi:formylglycine-generating enzyme required for sulfatase activity